MRVGWKLIRKLRFPLEKPGKPPGFTTRWRKRLLRNPLVIIVAGERWKTGTGTATPEAVSGFRNIFALYAIAAAALGLVAVTHLGALLATSPAFFAGDRLPKQALVTNVAPVEPHSAGGQNPNTLVKPVELK